MKKILVLGAGLVSRPGVSYLLDNRELVVTVADKIVKNAERLIDGKKNGRAVELDVADDFRLNELIKENDIIVSLLPWTFHVKVAGMSLKNGKNMVTASYVSREMKELDPKVRERGLLFLNEMGVDPGIDHMSAMSIIDKIHSEGGKIVEFYSYCGGLPAPEANDNPFGYKFSWSPKGVVLASKNPAKYLKNGKVVNIKESDLFLNYKVEEVESLGDFEVYPNRDSLPYKELYGLDEAETVMRGTYRNLGWCDTMKKIVDLGLVDTRKREGLKGKSYGEIVAEIIGEKNDKDLKNKVAVKLGVEKDSWIISNLLWLGLFSNEKVVSGESYLDILSDLLLKKLKYKKNERDMLILQHKFIVKNSNGSRDMITSTMIDYGIPGGDSAMARTVSLPLAIGVKLMAEEKFTLKGVRIPNVKEIYEPVLSELKELGIEMREKRVRLSE